MNTLKGFKDFDKVIRPTLPKSNHGRKHTLLSIEVGWAEWQSIAANDFLGVFEVHDYKFTHHGSKFRRFTQKLDAIQDTLPQDAYIRLKCCNHKAEPVIVRLMGWSRDGEGKPIIQIEHSERFCYTTPVAGSKGGKKPEPQ